MPFQQLEKMHQENQQWDWQLPETGMLHIPHPGCFLDPLIHLCPWQVNLLWYPDQHCPCVVKQYHYVPVALLGASVHNCHQLCWHHSETPVVESVQNVQKLLVKALQNSQGLPVEVLQSVPVCHALLHCCPRYQHRLLIRWFFSAMLSYPLMWLVGACLDQAPYWILFPFPHQSLLCPC